MKITKFNHSCLPIEQDEVRQSFYPRLKDFFAQHDIIFKGIENGELLEA